MFSTAFLGQYLVSDSVGATPTLSHPTPCYCLGWSTVGSQHRRAGEGVKADPPCTATVPIPPMESTHKETQVQKHKALVEQVLLGWEILLSFVRPAKIFLVFIIKVNSMGLPEGFPATRLSSTVFLSNEWGSSEFALTSLWIFHVTKVK